MLQKFLWNVYQVPLIWLVHTSIEWNLFCYIAEAQELSLLHIASVYAVHTDIDNLWELNKVNVLHLNLAGFALPELLDFLF